VAAIYTCLLAIYFHSNRQTAEEVVRSNMGTIYCISDDREFVWWGYPSEPILPSSILYFRSMKDNDWNFDSQLQKLSTLVQTGMVEAGYRGELVSRFLLHEAYAQAYFKSNQEIPMPVLLTDYLDELFVIPPSTGYSNWGEFMNGEAQEFLSFQVYLTHFVYLTYSPTHDELKEYFLRGAGIHCRRNENAIDHLIPIWDGTEFSYILISVKNQQERHSGWDNMANTCTPFVCHLEDINTPLSNPYMVILMEVNAGLNHDPKIKIHQQSTRRSPRIQSNTNIRPIFEICFFGLSESHYTFLKKHPNLLKRLQNLAVAFADPIKIIQSQKKVASVAEEVVKTLLCVNYD
jgi:hypothetical protein